MRNPRDPLLGGESQAIATAEWLGDVVQSITGDTPMDRTQRRGDVGLALQMKPMEPSTEVFFKRERFL